VLFIRLSNAETLDMVRSKYVSILPLRKMERFPSRNQPKTST
jgi:hypothetical protein